MVLVNSENVIHYLAEHRLMTVESAVDGDFMVLDQSSRNRNLKVLRRRSPGFFLKQAPNRSAAYLRTLEREAACYDLAARNPHLGGLAALLPRLHRWDAARGLLVLELLPNAESLWEYHLRMQSFPIAMAELQAVLEVGGRLRSDLEDVVHLAGDRVAVLHLRELADTLETRMTEASEEMRYELAAKYRDLRKTVLAIAEQQKMATSPERDVDIFGYYREGARLAAQPAKPVRPHSRRRRAPTRNRSGDRAAHASRESRPGTPGRGRPDTSG